MLPGGGQYGQYPPSHACLVAVGLSSPESSSEETSTSTASGESSSASGQESTASREELARQELARQELVVHLQRLAKNLVCKPCGSEQGDDDHKDEAESVDGNSKASLFGKVALENNSIGAPTTLHLDGTSIGAQGAVIRRLQARQVHQIPRPQARQARTFGLSSNGIRDLVPMMLQCRNVVARAGRFYIGVCEDYDVRWNGRLGVYAGHWAEYDEMTRLGQVSSQTLATDRERQLIFQHRGINPLCMNNGPGGEHVSILGPWYLYIVWCWPAGHGSCIRNSIKRPKREGRSICTVADDLR
jgi:hypothetical protein